MRVGPRPAWRHLLVRDIHPATGISSGLAYIGPLGGLLAELGVDVYAVSSLPGRETRPAFVSWVGGGETTSEHEYLAAIEAPGLSIRSDFRGAQAWRGIEPEGQPTDVEFIRLALHNIRRLTNGERAPEDALEQADVSTVSSTVRPGTGGHRAGRTEYGEPPNPSSRA